MPNDKIDSLKVKNDQGAEVIYDIDLPPDAEINITSATIGTATITNLNVTSATIGDASGNRAANATVKAAAQGQVNTSVLAITQKSATTTDNVVKAKVQYNATDDCIEFIFQ